VRRGAAILLTFFLAGCPDSKGKGDAQDPNAVPATGKIPKKPKEPAAAEPEKPDAFPREELIELYKADQLGDESVKKKYGLVGPDGKEIPAKRDEYEAALARFAKEHSDELGRISDEIEAARTTSASVSSVKKK